MNLKNLFPISYNKSMLVALVTYLCVAIVAGFIGGWIPVAGPIILWILRIVSIIVELYVVIGIVVKILVAVNVLK